MSCERHREAVLDAALGGDPSPTLEAHFPSCPACRALLDSERQRLARIDDELRQALAVEPSAWLLPRVRERASREATSAGPWRAAWLLPAAASVVALAVLLPLARRTSPPAPRPPRAAPSAPVGVSTPFVSAAEASGAPAGAETRGKPPLRRARAALARPRPAAGRPAGAQSAGEPEVLVPSGGEAALRRFVEAIRDRRLGGESVLGLGPDPVTWKEAGGMPQWPGPLDRLPAEAERVGAAPDIVPRTLSD